MRTLQELSQEELTEVHRRVLELRERGVSYSQITKEISKELNVRVSKATVLRWCKGTHNTFNKMKKINLNSSPALAYIVGVYIGDASLLQKSNHRYGIRLKVIDKDFAEAFAKALREIGLNPSVGFEREKTRSNRWYVEAYGKGLFTFLKGPRERLFDVTKAYPREFLRGFFDSEGTVGYSSNSAKSRLCVSAANYDLDVLELCSELLDELDIHSKIYLKSPKGTPVKIRGKWYEYKQDLYEIRVYRRKSVLNYYLQIGFTIQRKQQKLAQVLYELGLLNEQI